MSIDKRFALQQTARFAVLDAPGGELVLKLIGMCAATSLLTHPCSMHAPCKQSRRSRRPRRRRPHQQQPQQQPQQHQQQWA